MFQRLYVPTLILAWLVSVFDPSLGGYLVEPVVCTNVVVNLDYSQPLPAASDNSVVTTYATDHGVWNPCQLGTLNTSISYYLTLTATNANCEKATFTNFVFTGFFNCSTIGQEPARAKNLTVPLSDPNEVRYLNETQAFLGPIVVPFSVTVPCLGTIQFPFSVTVPGFGLLYAVNFTFIFPEANHQPGTCKQIKSEQVAIIPQLYLINLPNQPNTPFIPPVTVECQ